MIFIAGQCKAPQLCVNYGVLAHLLVSMVTSGDVIKKTRMGNRSSVFSEEELQGYEAWHTSLHLTISLV